MESFQYSTVIAGRIPMLGAGVVNSGFSSVLASASSFMKSQTSQSFNHQVPSVSRAWLNDLTTGFGYPENNAVEGPRTQG